MSIKATGIIFIVASLLFGTLFLSSRSPSEAEKLARRYGSSSLGTKLWTAEVTKSNPLEALLEHMAQEQEKKEISYLYFALFCMLFASGSVITALGVSQEKTQALLKSREVPDDNCVACS